MIFCEKIEKDRKVEPLMMSSTRQRFEEGKLVVSRSEELVTVWLSSEFKLSLGLEDWKAIHFCGFVVVFSIVNYNKKPL
jgi:hypothetical protein